MIFEIAARRAETKVVGEVRLYRQQVVTGRPMEFGLLLNLEAQCEVTWRASRTFGEDHMTSCMAGPPDKTQFISG